eukprot:gene5877-6118_t
MALHLMVEAPVTPRDATYAHNFVVSTRAGNPGGSACFPGSYSVQTLIKARTESSKKKPPIYKVMLHNDNYNRREYVVKILLKTVEGLTVDDAVNVMQEAHETGVALVVACAQEQAESYVESLRLNGLISTMEPGH